jgi:hypothetical protein
MAWYGNVRFKQRAITEFLVTEKELVTNIHRRLECSYIVNAVDKSTFTLWASWIVGFENGQVEHIDARLSDRPTTVVTQNCFNVLIKSWNWAHKYVRN